MPIRLLIVDDHTIVREGLHLLLGDAPTLTIVDEAADGPSALDQAERLHPDVVLLDLVLPGLDGIEVLRRLRAQPGPPRVLILTSFADDNVVTAIQAGATGYLLKDVLQADLISAIEHAARDEPVLHPEAQRRLVRHMTAPALEALTDREREVLALIAQGQSNREIAASLNITEGTVKGHVSHILAKLDLHDRTQAAVYAVQQGLGRPAR
jgi:DNA-binding NarL/FixJ family response regulator